MSFGNPVAGGGGQLIREVLKSVNYVAGLLGWQVSRDGDAEFNNLIARGTVTVSDPDGSEIELLASGGAKVALETQDVPGVTKVTKGEMFATYSGDASDGYASLVINTPEVITGGVTRAPGSFMMAGERANGLPFPNMDNVNSYLAWNGDYRIAGQLTTGGRVNNFTDDQTYRRGQIGRQAFTTAAAASTFVQSVVFSTPFPIGVTPFVTLTMVSGSGNASLWSLRTNNLSNTGFDIVGSRSTPLGAGVSLSANVDWQALI
jgi:hypothetical protein